jgi:hypothetical protein
VCAVHMPTSASSATRARKAVLITGSMLVIFSAFCFAAGVWRELFPGAPPPDPDVRKIPPILLLCRGALVAGPARANVGDPSTALIASGL